ncbi:YdcH family protein [Acuticoccus sp. MNP-M23]|nr:YdcH family protein [Acuticoccus sp. MNP-M23]WMS45087.1 YdcH family protein [Acuticoccus sp. MNP-M23]
MVSLEKKHAALENQLQSITTQPSADSLTAAALKREKLRLKDELERLRN